MPGAYAMQMSMLVKPVLILCMLAIAPGSLSAHVLRDRQDHGQETALERKQRGAALGSRELEARARAAMPGAQYLGFDYEPSTNIYTHKFLRNGSVILLQMDGRTGRILRRIGN